MAGMMLVRHLAASTPSLKQDTLIRNVMLRRCAASEVVCCFESADAQLSYMYTDQAGFNIVAVQRVV